MIHADVDSDAALKSTIIVEGKAESAAIQKGDVAVVHYTGRLMNEDGSEGKEFDSSVKRGTPFEFPVGIGYVIRGWDIAVGEMKIGEKRRVVIPSSLGYGASGIPGVIPKNATLIFDIELLDVKPKKTS